MRRFLLCLDDDGFLTLNEIAADAHVVSMEELGRRIADPGTHVGNKELLREIAYAAALRACCGAYTTWQTMYGQGVEKIG